jgi:hypothetical protein
MPEISDTPIGRLRKAVIGQKTASLPDRPKDPILQPIYDLLYEYDQFTTQLVINVLQGKLAIEEYPQRKQIDKMIAEFASPLDPMVKRELDLYMNYLHRLDNMMTLVKAVVSDKT